MFSMAGRQYSSLHYYEEDGMVSGVLSTRSEIPTLAFFPSVTQMIADFMALSQVALIIVDSEGRIVLVNGLLETLFGYPHEELMGQPLEILLPERSRAAHVALRTRYMSAPFPRAMGAGLDLVGRRKDGGEIPIEISLRPLLIEKRLHVLVAVRDLTAQRLTERERVQLNQCLHLQSQLINLAHDAIIVRDPENHIISWNRGAEDLYGWREQEARGQVIHSLLKNRFPISQAALDHDLEQQGDWEGKLTQTSREGRQIIVESRQVLVRDEKGTPTAILSINRDVTERCRLEQMEQEARAEEKARLDVLQLILDQLPSGIFLVQGPQARLILANRATVDIWGADWKHDQPMEDFLKEHAVSFLSENGRPLSSTSLPTRQAVASGEPVLHKQLVVRHPDGTSIPILVSAIPLKALHTLHHLPREMAGVLTSPEQVVLGVYQDVTALKEAEALKDQFVSLATHELRTPVTVLAGYTDMLLRRAARDQEHKLDEWQSKRLQEVKQATQQLAKLTEDLLDVTRVQAGQFQLRLSPTDLVALTRKVADQLQTTTERHHLSVQAALPHVWAMVDAFRIEQVLANLLSNAIKYSPQGGPVEVTIGKDAKTRAARLSVRDYGMGIPYKQQAYLFGRFVRADNARAAGIRGTGLGLYLCRELIERHGGYICFESREGVGTTFFFSLPCNR
jgi:PAS domain S-box-containing protein